MSRSTHNQRIARGLKKATGLAYQTCLNKVIAAAEAGLLPTPLDDAGIEKAVAMLASGIVVSAPIVEGDVLVEGVFDRSRGLVLVVGPTGTGKTSLMYKTAVQRSERGDRVITIEDPVEQILDQPTNDPGSILQMEHGRNGVSYADVRLQIQRRSPDVVIHGDLRNAEQVEDALMWADTGRFVVAGLHASDAPGAVDRLISTIVAHQQPAFRKALAEALIAVVVMRREDGKFSQETTIVDAEMREAIRTGDRRLSLPIGEDASGREVSWRPGWEDYPALSVIGQTGSGKSVLAGSLARSAREQDVEVFVIDTIKDGADYREIQTVIRTDKGALRLLDNLRTIGPFERLLIVEEPQVLRPDVIENLRRLVAEARSLRLQVVLVSQQGTFLGGTVGSTVDFTPGTARHRGWAQFHDRSKARHVDVRVWGPTVEEIAAERRAQEIVAAPKAVAVDLRRLSTLLRAGLAPAPALAAVAKSSRNDLAREAFTQMAQVVGDGDAELSDALRAHPHLFDEWIAAAVEAGETAGIISQILDDVARTLAAEVA